MGILYMGALAISVGDGERPGVVDEQTVAADRLRVLF